MDYEYIKSQINKLVDKIKSGSDEIEILYEKKNLINLCAGDPYLLNSINEISKDNFDNYIGQINTYLDSNISKSIEDTISKTFGIDISEISHKMLSSGIEVFSFYDSKYGISRMLENPKEGLSLTEQLKQIQNDNVRFQGEKNYKENANEILKSEIEKFDCELQMIPINDINKYQYIIDKLEEKERKAFDYLIKNKDTQDIAYINIENLVAITTQGKIIESVIIKNNLTNMEELRIEAPKEYQYRVSEMDNKNNIENSINEMQNNSLDNDAISNENSINFDEFEDMPELIGAELLTMNQKPTNEDIRNIKDNIIKFYNNPDQMINLPENEREFYEKMIKILSEKIEAKNKNNMQNKMIYKPENNGFNSILLVSVILIILCVIIFIIMQ